LGLENCFSSNQRLINHGEYEWRQTWRWYVHIRFTSFVPSLAPVLLRLAANGCCHIVDVTIDDVDHVASNVIGPLPSAANEGVMRRERLRSLALDSMDIKSDPYFMKNHLGKYGMLRYYVHHHPPYPLSVSCN
jgi:hypothetical protein